MPDSAISNGMEFFGDKYYMTVFFSQCVKKAFKCLCVDPNSVGSLLMDLLYSK